jgi:hypothetical protein
MTFQPDKSAVSVNGINSNPLSSHSGQNREPGPESTEIALKEKFANELRVELGRYWTEHRSEVMGQSILQIFHQVYRPEIATALSKDDNYQELIKLREYTVKVLRHGDQFNQNLRMAISEGDLVKAADLVRADLDRILSTSCIAISDHMDFARRVLKESCENNLAENQNLLSDIIQSVGESYAEKTEDRFYAPAIKRMTRYSDIMTDMFMMYAENGNETDLNNVISTLSGPFDVNPGINKLCPVIQVPSRIFTAVLSDTLGEFIRFQNKVKNDLAEQIGKDRSFLEETNEKIFEENPYKKIIEKIHHAYDKIDINVESGGEVVISTYAPALIAGQIINDEFLELSFQKARRMTELYKGKMDIDFDREEELLTLRLVLPANYPADKTSLIESERRMEILKELNSGTEGKNSLFEMKREICLGESDPRKYRILVSVALLEDTEQRNKLGELIPRLDRFMAFMSHFDSVVFIPHTRNKVNEEIDDENDFEDNRALKSEKGAVSLRFQGELSRANEKSGAECVRLESFAPEMPTQPVNDEGNRPPPYYPVFRDDGTFEDIENFDEGLDYSLYIDLDAFNDPGIMTAVSELDKVADILCLPLSEPNFRHVDAYEKDFMTVMENVLVHLNDLTRKVMKTHNTGERFRLELNNHPMPIDTQDGMLVISVLTALLTDGNGNYVASGRYSPKEENFRYEIKKDLELSKMALQRLRTALSKTNIFSEYSISEFADELRKAGLQIPNMLITDLMSPNGVKLFSQLDTLLGNIDFEVKMQNDGNILITHLDDTNLPRTERTDW